MRLSPHQVWNVIRLCLTLPYTRCVRSLFTPATDLCNRFREGGFAAIIRGLRNQVVRKSESLGLCRDLSRPHKAPQAKIPITVRRGEPRDLESLVPNADSAARSEQRELRIRASHAAADFGRLYVAGERDSGRICFVQWVMDHHDNGAIKSFFQGRFPALGPEEILFENAYTASSHRGLGVMPEAMAAIAEREREGGFRRCLTFVACHNTASIKGCERAGFSPYVLRRDIAFFGGLVRWRRFLPLPPSQSAQDTAYTGGEHGDDRQN